MTKFKIGDKVRIINASASTHNNGDEGVIVGIDGLFYDVYVDGNKQSHYAEDIELISQTPTKNQRITALESEVAELKAKVEALEKAQSPTKTITQNITVKSDADITKVASQLAKLIEGETDKRRKKSPNERRKAIIAEAKAFINEVKTDVSGIPAEGMPWVGTQVTLKSVYMPMYEGFRTASKAEFYVNKDKRSVTVLLKGVITGNLYAKAIAKCAPDDVFNADIGKAIALGRALGLDVSKFEQAVKPTEVVVGMKVTACFDGKTREYTARNVYKEGGEVRVNPKEVMLGYYPYEPHVGDRIIDDTEAVY